MKTVNRESKADGLQTQNQLWTTEIMHVGVGHPRMLYVLYPHKGIVYLCQGAVMPYYEFTEPSPRLTDKEWRMRLDENPPSLPDWAKPIYADEHAIRTKGGASP